MGISVVSRVNEEEANKDFAYQTEKSWWNLLIFMDVCSSSRYPLIEILEVPHG